MADLQEVLNLIESQGRDLKSFNDKTASRFGAIESTLDDLAKKAGRPGLPAVPSDSGALASALKSFARTGDERELKAMTVTSDPAGGYAVIPQWDSAIRLIRDRVSPLSALCRNVTMDTGTEFRLPFSRSTLTGTWVSETDTRATTADPELGEHLITLREVYVAPAISQLLLDQASYPIDQVLTDMIGHGLATTEATALHTGDGVGRPRGILSYTTAATGDASRTLGTIEHVATGASGAFATTNPLDTLVTTVGKLAPQYRANAVWLMNRGTAATIQQFKSDTFYHWQPAVTQGQPATLLGYPVVIDDSMTDVAANSLSIAFGDFQAAYCIVRTPGLRLLRDPFTSKGSVIFYAFQRIGGKVVDDRAVKLVKFAAS